MSLETILPLERESIRSFVQRAADDAFLRGRVLDYGSGRQPYRGILEKAGCIYHPFDPALGPSEDWRLNGAYDSILCTQVIQYLPDVEQSLADLGDHLVPGGCLVITGPTSWPIVECNDLWRFTAAGIKQMLEVDFSIVRLEDRGQFEFDGDDRWLTGWAAIARV